MQLQQLLREENYHLKNEISELKNAFDLNRDILQIVSRYDKKSDPQQVLFMQIIAKLTEVSNQALLNAVELLQEKNTLKQEIYRLNVALDKFQQRFNIELQRNAKINTPTQANVMLYQQFGSLNRQLMAFHEEKITYQQEAEFWKQNFTKRQTEKVREEGGKEGNGQSLVGRRKIKRKYTSNENVKADWLMYELERENKRLKQYVQELQNRLALLARAHTLQEECGEEKEEQLKLNLCRRQIQQVKLMKYALNDFSINKKNDNLYMTINYRFKEAIDRVSRQERRVHSWPKYKEFKYQIESEDNLVKFVQKTLNTEDSKQAA